MSHHSLRIASGLLASTGLLPAQDPQATGTEPLFALLGDAYRTTAAIGDLNGDGHADLVIGSNGGFLVAITTTGRAARMATPAPLGASVEPSCESACQPHLVDLDGDGDLDLAATDTPLGGKGTFAWLANDGAGRFGAKQVLRDLAGEPLRCDDNTSAIAFADWNGDGHTDLLVACGGIRVHVGNGRGFAKEGAAIGLATQGAMIATDFDGNGRCDLATVDGDRWLLHLRNEQSFAAPRLWHTLAGDPGQAQAAWGNWRGDDKPCLLLSESILAPARPAPPQSPEERAHVEAARQVLEAVEQQLARLNRTPPPRDDDAAMKRRAALRDDLERWAAAPRRVLEQAMSRHVATRSKAAPRLLDLPPQ